MARVRLSWMNDSNPTETKLIAVGEFCGDDIGGKVMAWAQATILAAMADRPDGWSPLLEEVPPEVENKANRRLALGSAGCNVAS